MRAAIIGLLWTAFAIFLLPLIQGRLMDEAPGWVWRIIYFACILVGVAVVLASDPVWPRISRPQERAPLIGLAIIAVSAAIVLGAAWWIFLGNHIVHKLGFFASVSTAQEPPGTVIAGIHWRPPYAQVQLFVLNAAKVPVTNVELRVRADYPIAAISQSSNLDDVSISADDAPQIQAAIHHESTETTTGVPFERLATEADYVVRCNQIRENQPLTLIIATVAGFEPSNALLGFGSNAYWTRINMTLNATGRPYATWFGYPNRPDSIYAPIAAPTVLHITGSYVSAGDTVPVDENVKLVNFFDVSLSKIRAEQSKKP
jgi:hypothetical protein